MLEHVLAAAAGVPALDRVVVVLGAQAEAVRRRVDLHGAEAATCPGWEEGQAASLRCGVAALNDAEAALILLGDQPRISARVIAGVLDRRAPQRWDAVRAAYAGVPGHPVALERPLLARVRELRGDVGARGLLAEARGRVRTWEAGHLADPRDVDTPEALTALT